MTFVNLNFSNNCKLRSQGTIFKIGLIAVGLLVCNILLGYYSRHTSPSIDVLDFFTEAGGDGSRITWAHSTNSRHSLEEALLSKVMILEADVSSAESHGSSLPIMAHPPMTISDMTLSEWLAEVMKYQKGIKLNFKHIEVVEPSIEIIKKQISEVKFPILLSADILQGPTNTISIPLKADKFLQIGQRLLRSTLCLGWTTFLDPNVPFPAYTHGMVNEMISLLKKSEVQQSVIFSVRACIAKNSIHQLKHLLKSVDDSSLMVWSSQGDPISADDLMKFRHHFDMKKVYYDLSSPLREEFLQSISKHEFR